MVKIIDWLKRPRDRTVDSGIVEAVDRVNRHLSFFTLRGLDFDGESRVPVYVKIKNPAAYHGSCVDIVSFRQGYFGSDFVQEVTTSEGSNTMTMPFSHVKRIRESPEAFRRNQSCMYFGGA